MKGGSGGIAGQVGHTGQLEPDTVVGAGHTFAIFADPSAGIAGCGGAPEAQPASTTRIVTWEAKRAASCLARAKMWTEVVLR